MKEIDLTRSVDPGRGAFCAVTKQGVLVNAPPARREPRMDKKHNPRATRHIQKTYQDSLPVKERPRYQAWLKRQEAMKRS